MSTILPTQCGGFVARLLLMRDAPARWPGSRFRPALRLRLPPTELNPCSGKKLPALQVRKEGQERRVAPCGPRAVIAELQRKPLLQRACVKDTLLLLSCMEERVEQPGLLGATHGTS